VVPFHSGDSFAVTTALGMPRKANEARRNPRVALLFSDATGAGIDRPAMVLVQGSARVDDADLGANRRRYRADTAAKPSGPLAAPVADRFDWYFTRIYIEIRPERALVWRGSTAVPDVLGSLPETAAPAPGDYGGIARPNRRIAEIGRRYDTAVLSAIGPAGYPFSVRLPMTADRRGRSIAIHAEPTGIDLRPGPVCVTAHDHDPELRWARNFQVRGDLLRDAHGWLVVPHRVVDGFELPPTGSLVRAIANIPKIRRFRRTAARERSSRSLP
jgi:hypothetical protein